MSGGGLSRFSGLAHASRAAVAARIGISPSALSGVLVTVAIAAFAVIAVSTGAMGSLLGHTPPAIRNLPGVSVVVGPIAPAYEASIVGLKSPLSVAVTADGSTLYVVEGTGDRVVRRIHLPDGNFDGALAPPLTTPATRKPMSVAVRSDGVVYVVDQARRTVDLYSQNGDWMGTLPAPGKDNDWSPLSVDVDDDGGAYVTNFSDAGPLLVYYGRDEKVAGTWASVIADEVPVKFPNGVAVTRSGDIAITDSNNARIVLLDRASGAAFKVWSRPTETLAVPRGIVIERNGLGLIADANDHTLSAWDLRSDGDGRAYQFGAPGMQDDQFLFPNDVVIDRTGRIYVADRDNGRVQVWR